MRCCVEIDKVKLQGNTNQTSFFFKDSIFFKKMSIGNDGLNAAIRIFLLRKFVFREIV